MKLVGPAREHPSPPKLVEPAREHPSPPKLVEPDCDEGAVRVETPRPPQADPSVKRRCRGTGLSDVNRHIAAKPLVKTHVPFNNASIAPGFRSYFHQISYHQLSA